MVCALCWFLQQFLCIKSQNCRQQNSPHSIPVNTVQGPLSESPCVAAVPVMLLLKASSISR